MTRSTGGHDEGSYADAGAEGAGRQPAGGRDASAMTDQGGATTATGIDTSEQRPTPSSGLDVAGLDQAMGDDGADDSLPGGVPGGANSAGRDDAPASGDDQGLDDPANLNAFRFRSDMDQGTSNT